MKHNGFSHGWSVGHGVSSGYGSVMLAVASHGNTVVLGLSPDDAESMATFLLLAAKAMRDEMATGQEGGKDHG